MTGLLPQSCSYELDHALHLVAVDDAFATFARLNGAPELVPPRCLGRSVLASIADGTTAHVYRQLFDRVRARGAPTTFPIRCDGPAERRHLTVVLSPRAGGFRVDSRIDRVEPRAAQPLLDGRRTPAEDVLRMCGWCKRVDAEGEWMEVEQAVRALRLFERDVLPAVSHAMCEACYASITRLLD